MYIQQMFAQKECLFSIECFPPKQTANYEKMKKTLFALKELHPDFISVTYGAGGSAGGVSSVEIAKFLKNEVGVEPLAHLICMGSDQQSMAQTLDALFAGGIQNVLALRGDRTPLRPESKDFKHASDLAAFVRGRGWFGISGACYPEGHPESESLRADVEALKIKQEAGVSHLTTQLFMDNNQFYRFVNRVRKVGVNLPISAGIMPITKVSQIEKTLTLSSTSIPAEFTKLVARWQDDPESFYKAGIEYSVTQLRDLIESGVDGVHLYAMNDANIARAVYEGIEDLL